MASVFDNEDLKAVKELRKELINLGESFDKVAKTIVATQKALSKQAESHKELTDEEKKLIAVQKELTKLDKQLETSAAKLTAEYKKKNEAVLKAKEAVRKSNEEQKKGLGIQSGFVNGIKQGITQFALMAGAITGVVAGLVKFGKQVIASSDALSDKWEVAVATAKGATDGFFRTIANGDFSNFLKNITSSALAARDYAKALDEIEDRNRAALIQEQKKEYLVGIQLKILRSQLKSDDEKKAAGIEILRLEQEYANTQMSIAKFAKDELVTKFAKIGVTEESLEKNLINLEQNKDLVDEAEKYLTLLEERKILEEGMTPALLKESKAYANNLESIKNISKEAKEFSSMREKFTETLGTKDLDAAAKIFADYYKSLGLFDSETQRVNSMLTGVMAKQEKQAAATVEAIEEIKLVLKEDDFVTFYDKITKANDDLLKEIAGFSDDKMTTVQAEYDELDRLLKEDEAKTLESYNAKTEAAKKYQEDINAIESELKEQGIETINGLFDLRASYRESEIAALEKQRDYEVALAESKGQSTVEIEKKFADKEAKLRHKNDVSEKLQKLFNAAIDIAGGIIKYGSNPVTAPLLPFFIGLSAAQLGLIAATPLPKYWKGTTAHIGGPALVGDSQSGGSQTELVDAPGMGRFLVNHPTLMDLPKGSKVFDSHSQKTKEALNQFNDNNIVKELRAIKRSQNRAPRFDDGWLKYRLEERNVAIKQRARRFQ